MLKVQPHFGVNKKLTTVLGTSLLALAPLGDVQAQIPLKEKQPVKQVKQADQGPQINNVKELSEFRELLIMEERKLAQSLLNLSNNVSYMGAVFPTTLWSDNEKATEASKDAYRIGIAISHMNRALRAIRETNKRPPPVEDVRVMKMTLFLTAKAVGVWQKAIPNWQDPDAFGLLYSKKGHLQYADPKDFNKEEGFKEAHNVISVAAKNLKTFRGQLPVVLKGIKIYNEAAKRIGRPGYKAYWGLDQAYINELQRLMRLPKLMKK